MNQSIYLSLIDSGTIPTENALPQGLQFLTLVLLWADAFLSFFN